MTEVYVFLATYAIALPVLVIAIQFVLTPRQRKARFALVALVSCVLALLVAKVANHFFINPRPFVSGNFAPLIPHAPDNGFPSDHALFAGALAAVSSFFSMRFGIAMWIIAVLIGVGRIMTHVHHTIDIVGAFGIAAISVAVVASVLARSRS